MRNWTRALSISAISGAVAVSVGASAQTADPPLLSFFTRFCVDTRGDEEAIEKLVLEAPGGEVTITPETDTSPRHLRWEKTTGADKIVLTASSVHFQGESNKRFTARDIPVCQIFDYSHDVAGADAIRKWVGVPPSKMNAGRFDITYDYTYQEAAGVRWGMRFEKFYYTDDVWWLRVTYPSGSGAIFVELSHNNEKTMPAGN